ncbi:MAG: alpha-2-macroglobulin, partial [Sphingobacteriales bacterium 12-47-4]
FLFDRALTWRIVASSTATNTLAQGAYSDGEEASLPVLTNRMLVTETLPLHLRDTGTKTFKFDKLLNAGGSETLQHHSLTVEYTSNPVWYAVQSLPYLMEYPYECAEQTWNRFYANALAGLIANSSPRIKAVFESWKGKDTAALLSNLQKNEELKSILLEETPWVLDARNESEQKKKIALLFDLYRLSDEANTSLEKLTRMQNASGAFVWFQGGPDDRYITQYIVTGIGHLLKLNAASATQKKTLENILAKALPYLDKKIKEDHDQLKKRKANLALNQIGQTQVQYLYLRSFFPERKIPAASQAAYTYYRTQAQKFWTKQGKYAQGMIALALHRTKDTKTPAAVIKSLKETSINNPELGRYWKLSSGWFWYQAPVETQALLIEAFSEIGNNQTTVNELKTWLLKNKQTNHWSTTKATAEACYSLLLRGEDWLSQGQEVQIDLGPVFVTSGTGAEAGTGYIKKTIEGRQVEPAMGDIKVQVKNTSTAKSGGSPSWGAVYWQYFEDLDKITSAETPLKLNKKLFIKKNGERGPVLHPINEGDVANVGDRITVRIELRVDRDMEYVHMKDMRASSLEPVNVLSGYRWQDGLGYYESTRDASTNFFFHYLQKGTYVFEYELFVTHKGEFSNGVTTIQCMYAPEFTSHSEGVRV